MNKTRLIQTQQVLLGVNISPINTMFIKMRTIYLQHLIIRLQLGLAVSTIALLELKL